MAVAPRMLLLITIVAIASQQALAQQSHEDVTIKEPAVYQLASLFKQADTVALVKVVSGDTETYSGAVYKAEVVKSFKGAAVGETLYFGPYVGTRLGWEYIVFLRKVSKPIAPNTTSSTGFGTIQYAEIFNEGYGSMETSYECVFNGNEVAQKCDYAVRICTDYIKLPTSMPTYPPMTDETPFGCRKVRKSVFVAALDTIGGPRK
jgi:hypothetical protein